MGYRPATSSEKPAPTSVVSVQESAVPDATDTSVFLVDGVLSYIGADGNVASLDLAGGGGGVGAEVDVYDKLNDAANNDELTLEDPTKGAVVRVNLYGQAADAVVRLGSYTGTQADALLCPSDGTVTLTLLVSPGETYYLDRNPNSTPTADPQVNWAIEKTIG